MYMKMPRIQTAENHLFSKLNFIKTVMRYHYLLECSKSGALTTPNAGENVEQKNSHSLAVRIQNSTAALGDSVAVSYTTKCIPSMWSSNCAPWHLPKGVANLCLHKRLHCGVHSSFIHNRKTLRETKMSFSRWINCGPSRPQNIIRC